MLIALVVGSLLVALTVFIHYETLRLTAEWLPRMKLPLRLRVLIVVGGCFAAHTIEVWIYAVAYLLLHYAGVGALDGHAENSFQEYLYFSVTSYSTVGFGEIYPVGVFRLISGLEALNGLFLIAWSTSFTYLAMEKLWPLHPRPRHERRSRPEQSGRGGGVKENHDV